MKKYIFALLSLCIGISLSTIAAYYSVIGLSKIFAGASFQVILMASFMEAGKITVATLLHNYWDNIEWKIKTYLTISVIILMVITSAGIYGLLSSAYQESYSEEKISERNISLIDSKIQNLSEIKKDLTYEKDNLSKDISTLRNSLGNNIIKYTDDDGNEVVTTSVSNRKVYVEQLNEATSRRDKINKELLTINDSIGNWEIEKINIKNSSEISSELLPLKYISKVSGLDMDYVANLFLILLIIVFDPLAIALILSANVLFKLKNKDKHLDKPSTELKVEEDPIENFSDKHEDQNKNKKEDTLKKEEKTNDKVTDDMLEEYAKDLKRRYKGLIKTQIKNMSHQEISNRMK